MSRILDVEVLVIGGASRHWCKGAVAWREVQAMDELHPLLLPRDSTGKTLWDAKPVHTAVTRLLLRDGREVIVNLPLTEARLMLNAYLHDYASKP